MPQDFFKLTDTTTQAGEATTIKRNDVCTLNTEILKLS